LGIRRVLPTAQTRKREKIAHLCASGKLPNTPENAADQNKKDYKRPPRVALPESRPQIENVPAIDNFFERVS
jgi:hypothetical protein